MTGFGWREIQARAPGVQSADRIDSHCGIWVSAAENPLLLIRDERQGKNPQPSSQSETFLFLSSQEVSPSTTKSRKAIPVCQKKYSNRL